MKKNQFSEMSAAELNEKVVELKKELFNLRFQLATGQLQDTTAIVNTKREIARAKRIPVCDVCGRIGEKGDLYCRDCGQPL